ncbi:MAG: hypothetical protein CL521_02875 [Actinobacteria bacterium]|nr:hypothetical protein [Actinomycetota bacterium]
MTTRIFISSDDYHQTYCQLSSDVAHHLNRVLRLKPKDPVALVIDGEKVQNALITSFSRDVMNIESVSAPVAISISSPTITLFQCLPKQAAFSSLLNHCTQVGVQEFIPIISDRTVVQVKERDYQKKQHRWQEILRLASMQSKQDRLPSIQPIQVAHSCIQNTDWSKYDIKLLPWESYNQKQLSQVIMEQKSDFKAAKNIAIWIGPEGGISESEADQLSRVGFDKCSLGTSILTAQLAAFYTVAQLQFALSAD